MPANITQFTFEFLDVDYEVSVLDYFAIEKVSYLSGVNVTLVSNSKVIIPSEDVIRQEGLLTIINPYKNSLMPGTEEAPDRYFHGIIRKFRYIGMNGSFHTYEAQLVPSLWLLSLKTRCRIFQDMKLQDLIGKILQESGITSDLYEFRLQHDDIFNKFNMQYNETDLHFISRLLEKEGIFYFFEHYEDKHVLVFCDTDAYYQDIKGNTTIQINSGDGLVSVQESISSFDFSERLRSGTFTHTNYNFKTPSVKLETDFEGENNNPDEPFEVYTYPGSYGESVRGDRLAQIRLEAIVALKEKGRGASNCVLLTPGATFHLTDHKDPKINRECLLIEVSHGGSQPGALKEHAPTDLTPSYSNSFVVIPSTVTYRPEQRHLKPMVPGLLSAIVTGPKGEEIWPDEYGRVNVQFHFDREGKMDEKSSCWLRVVQFWNGPTWGSQFIPRIGDEVLVSFINGDMDYPVVIGSATNAAKPPNYNLPANKTQSGIRTRSSPGGNPDNYNELRFEDKKGSEEVFLQGEKDWNILIKNDKGQYVGHDETLNVRNNRMKTIGVDQTETVGSNHTETIGANKTESIGANKTETVAINKMETIGAAKELSIGGLYQVTVGGIMNETVACAKTEEVGLAKAVFVGTTMMENVVGDRTTNIGANLSEFIREKYYSKANEYIIEAPRITFKAGSSTIVMDGNSITIKASKVFTN
jgi:type VI secretion system secreted protein VgrG